MCANIKELRKEAYRLWGLGHRGVIYDFPSARPGNNRFEFQFKLDYADENASWPRAYAMAIENGESLLRVIVPIIKIQKIEEYKFERPGWYDVPFKLHSQILQFVEDDNFCRPLSFGKRLINMLLPKRLRFTGKVHVENYVYSVVLHHNELAIRLV